MHAARCKKEARGAMMRCRVRARKMMPIHHVYYLISPPCLPADAAHAAAHFAVERVERMPPLMPDLRLLSLPV